MGPAGGQVVWAVPAGLLPSLGLEQGLLWAYLSVRMGLAWTGDRGRPCDWCVPAGSVPGL